MMPLGQSLREAQRPIRPVVTPKHSLFLGTWNVRTMYATGVASIVARERERYNIDILGLCEVRWTGAWKVRLASGDTLLYVGNDNTHVQGVGIMLSERIAKTLIEWTPVSSRLITARFFSNHKNVTTIQVYAPTEAAVEEEKDTFYGQLQEIVDRCSRHDMIFIIGVFNAKMGCDNEGMDDIMGKEGIGVRDDNGERLCEFCQGNGNFITGTIFKHRTIHKDRNGRAKNQIDHVLVNKSMRTSVLDTRTQRGADAISEHYLVRCKIRLKLCKYLNRSKVKPKLDIEKLKDRQMREQYNVEVKNRYEALDVETLEECREGLEKVYVEAAEMTIGYIKRVSKPWVSAETWVKANEMREINMKINSTKSVQIK
ncbi:putative craniofacial development protein 2-like [Apostichopus japonicus]|uniref:Putative craniofacial development protein 2-like n=1 Tax=Stichopus japonicus TaxID=307972 RepID=A0A2G8K0H4_STIJA|nr:putative craniofacial development protein 2-like [Apostichopus japonicus]